MKLTLLITSLLAISCGSPPRDIEQLFATRTPIIGGTTAGATDFPAVGAVLFVTEDFGDTTGGLLCTATLVAPDTLLLAAHCLKPLPGDEVFYFTRSLDVSAFGETTVDPPADAVPVTGSVTHPDFDAAAIDDDPSPGVGDYHDIALAFLAAPVDGVSPNVATRVDDAGALQPGVPVSIAGYGKLSADLFIDDAGVKYRADATINQVGPAEIQIGGDQPAPRKCIGDSGGPTFMSFDDGRDPALRIIGVTSHAYDDTGCVKGGVDTRVDYHWDWIDQRMRGACDDGSRSHCIGAVGLGEPVFPETPDDPPPTGLCNGAGATPLFGLVSLVLLRKRRRRS